MKILNSIFFLFLSFLIQAQKIKIKFYDSTDIVNNVNCNDEKNKISFNTGESNELTLKCEYNSIIISHVTYETIQILINCNKDTIIKVQLKRKINNEKFIVVNSSHSLKNTVKIGNINTKTKSLVIINQALKFGFFIENKQKFKEYFMKSISFKIKKPKSLRNLDDYLEIKLYEYKNDSLIVETLNTLPIRLKCKDLKKTNKLEIKENIELPELGVFVSIEIPTLVTSNKTLVLNIPIEDKTSMAPYLSISNFKEWTKKIIKSKGQKNTNTGVSFSPLFEIELKY